LVSAQRQIEGGLNFVFLHRNQSEDIINFRCFLFCFWRQNKVTRLSECFFNVHKPCETNQNVLSVNFCFCEIERCLNFWFSFKTNQSIFEFMQNEKLHANQFVCVDVLSSESRLRGWVKKIKSNTCPQCCRVPEMWRDQCSYEPLVFIELRKYMIREEEDINLITKPFFIPSVGHLRPLHKGYLKTTTTKHPKSRQNTPKTIQCTELISE